MWLKIWIVFLDFKVGNVLRYVGAMCDIKEVLVFVFYFTVLADMGRAMSCLAALLRYLDVSHDLYEVYLHVH